MATHSSILTWGIPQTEEFGGLQSMGLQRVTQLSAHIITVEFTNLLKFSDLLRSITCSSKNLKGLPWCSAVKRIYLPMQETWVGSLVREDPTCHGVTKPACHNYCASMLEPTCHNYRSPITLESVLQNQRSHCNEKPEHGNQTVSPARCN